MSPPKQRPGKSVQVVSTPREFLYAVAARFGEITFDLAADEDHHVCTAWSGDSLALPWSYTLGSKDVAWCNPPYENMDPWVAQAARWSMLAYAGHAAKVLVLCPASVGSNWWEEWVRPHADALFLHPRLTFVGHEHPYPKDLALLIYDPQRYDMPRVSCRWQWTKEVT